MPRDGVDLSGWVGSLAMVDDANDPVTEDGVDDGFDENETDAQEAVTSKEAADLEDALDDDEVAAPPSEAKVKADAVIAARRAKDPSTSDSPKVERRVVTSRRVTPRAGAASSKTKDDAPAATSKARDAKKTESLTRTATPAADPMKFKGPSPWWVPALMFGLMVIGALVIMANYMGAFGDPENMRLVIGLVLILGGIITATQYR